MNLEEKKLKTIEKTLKNLKIKNEGYVDVKNFFEIFTPLLEFIKLEKEQRIKDKEEMSQFSEDMISIISTPIKIVEGKQGLSGKDGVSPALETIAYEASKLVEAKLTPLVPKIEDIEKDLPKLGESIRDGLELLIGENRLDITAIKGLDERFKGIEKKNLGTGYVIRRDIIQDLDISNLLDGVKKTFNIHGVFNIISVSLSSYPYGTLRKNIDYSFTETSITFLGTIDASTQLSAGQQCVLTVINP